MPAGSTTTGLAGPITTGTGTAADSNSRGGFTRPTDRAASRSKPTADSLEQGTSD